MSKGSYEIKVNHGAKTVEMYIGGTFTPTDVQNFVSDYQKEVSAINAPVYTLEIDCSYMDLLKQEMIPSLENSYKMYKESGFKKVIFKIKQNPVLKLQLNRLARNTGLTNAEVIEG
ncbi:hypothetical protein AB3Z07_21430 [Metabacillus halosaccharovorans]|uniref:hypothetical protein n=1 Tax=Metabacillus halosaccharovorans TaxID=930124 RepID=UPI0020424B5D|nr:hypothetical protein [Metabacillus halosaccharovorans]MCM3440061.1 hypothetical protein [Metabacillus halosaccharovorans]